MGAYRNSPTLFPTATSLPTYGLPFPKIGVRNFHPKLQSLLSQERVKLRTSNLATIITGSIRTKAHEKYWRKGSVGVSRDGPIFPGTPIISGMWKAMDFKFGRYIQRVYSNKSTLKILEKRLGVSRDCPILSGTPFYLRNG